MAGFHERHFHTSLRQGVSGDTTARPAAHYYHVELDLRHADPAYSPILSHAPDSGSLFQREVSLKGGVPPGPTLRKC